MQITEERCSGRYIITGYGHGFISVNEVNYEKSLIISAEKLITDWEIKNPAEITSTNMEIVDHLDPEIILIGTGETQIFPEARLIYEFMQQGIGCEIMDSAAACRTYNILLNESRNVIAALLLP